MGKKGKENLTINYALGLIITLGVGLLLIWGYRLLLGIVESYDAFTTLNLVYLIIGIIFIVIGVFLIYLRHLFSGFVLGTLGIVLTLLILYIYIVGYL